MKAKPKGAEGEDYAAGTLQELGYEILDRNFYSRYGEIDIIARKGDIIAFIEVKTRAPDSMGSGFEAVTVSKQRKIIATALWYMGTSGYDLQPRFDVMSVISDSGKIISHDYLEGAFDGGAYYKKYY